MVAQQKDNPTRFTCLQVQLKMVRTNRLPPMRRGVSRLTALYHDGVIPSTISAEEIFALSVKTRQGIRASKEGKVVAPFPVLGLMKNRPSQRAADWSVHLRGLNFTGVKVALKIRLVVPSIPQREFHG